MSAPACWGWKQCPEKFKDGPAACACLVEARRKGRRPTFGDYHEAAPLSRSELQLVARKCKNFRSQEGSFL